ncbi:MAG: HD domain-containing protein [archaeon]
MEDIITKLTMELKDMFGQDSSGHDLTHLQRVHNIALHLQEREGGDRYVIGIAAYVHDVHRIMPKEKGGYCTPTQSLPIIEAILKKAGVKKIPQILHCVEFHEEYAFSREGKTANDIETLIVQDADNLDAMGAMGIARTFMYGGAHGIPAWLPDEPFADVPYNEMGKDVSIIHHFHNKLLKLKENMNTRTAKDMAEHRHEFMEQFLKEYFSEWKGYA